MVNSQETLQDMQKTSWADMSSQPPSSDYEDEHCEAPPGSTLVAAAKSTCNTVTALASIDSGNVNQRAFETMAEKIDASLVKTDFQSSCPTYVEQISERPCRPPDLQQRRREDGAEEQQRG